MAIKLIRLCSVVLSLALLASMPIEWSIVRGQEKPKTEEERDKEESRKLFDAIHCQTPDPAAVKAFLGCWLIAQSWSAPANENLKLGMRAAEASFQVLLESELARHYVNSKSPRYCSTHGRSTVAPYPDVNFEEDSTYAYVMYDMAPSFVEQMAAAAAQHPEVDQKMIEQKVRTLREFARQGGKYIQTYIVIGRDKVWWDTDGEEDFWALPAPCEGWEEIQEKLKKLKKLEKDP
jgi:hypothetical protein